MTITSHYNKWCQPLAQRYMAIISATAPCSDITCFGWSCAPYQTVHNARATTPPSPLPDAYKPNNLHVHTIPLQTNMSYGTTNSTSIFSLIVPSCNVIKYYWTDLHSFWHNKTASLSTVTKWWLNLNQLLTTELQWRLGDCHPPHHPPHCHCVRFLKFPTHNPQPTIQGPPTLQFTASPSYTCSHPTQLPQYKH